KFLEQRFVAGDFPSAMLLLVGGRRGDWLRQRNLLPRLERRESGFGDFNDAELLGVLQQEAEPDKLAPNCAPLGPRMFAADIIGRELLMTELTDLVRV